MGQMAGTENLLTLGGLKLFFGGVAKESRQICSSKSKTTTTSPFPSASECQGRSCQNEKGHTSCRRQDALALLLIKSSPPRRPFIPLLFTRGHSHQRRPHTPKLGTPWASHSTATEQQAPGQQPGKVTAPREGKAKGMLALEIKLSVKYHSSWTCCLRDTFTPLPDI